MDPVLEPSAGGRVFDLARRLTFAGVELVVHRDELGSRERLEQLRAEKAEAGLEVPALVLAEHSDLGGIADRRSGRRRAGAPRRRARDRVGRRARGRRDPRPLLRPRRAPRRGRPGACGAGVRRRVPGGGRGGHGALLRGHAARGRDPTARRPRRIAGVRLLLRPRQCRRARAGHRDRDPRARPADPSRPLQGHPRDRRRLPSRFRPGGLRRERKGARRDRLRRLGRARDASGAPGARGTRPLLRAVRSAPATASGLAAVRDLHRRARAGAGGRDVPAFRAHRGSGRRAVARPVSRAAGVRRRRRRAARRCRHLGRRARGVTGT